MPVAVRRQFYAGVDRSYPAVSNTYGDYNVPEGLLAEVDHYPRDSAVLEIGAGGGFTLRKLRERGFTRLIASDLAPTAVVALRERLPGVPVVAADAAALPFAAECFDVVLSTDLIEHVPDLDRHLDEVRRVLRPGGRYLIKTPNRLLAERYYRLMGLFDAYFWHPSMASPSELERNLGAHGFSCRFLAPARLTAAQVRKLPLGVVRRAARGVPLSRLPVAVRVHLEVVATREA